MDATERTRLHRCAKCGEEQSAVESCDGDCYPLCGPCHVELRHEDAEVWRARMDAAERERDDARAIIETLRAEAALLRSIIEGRTTPPTDAEIAAHEARGGTWLVGGGTIHRARDAHETRTMCERRAKLCAECPPGWPAYRWLALDSHGRPCAWPTVTP